MKNSKKKLIQRMEYEDDQGIIRKKQVKAMSLKTFKYIKFGLICLLPIIYFLYSPLLILVAFAYCGLYFIARGIEKKTNGSLKKEYRITVPKFDSIVMMIAIVITIAGILLSLTTTTMRTGMFEGKSDAEISAEMEERGLSSSQITEMLKRMKNRGSSTSRFVRQLTNAGTMLTGETILFESQSVGPRMVRMSSDFTPPENMTPPEGFSPPNGMDFARNIPFSMLFQNIAKSINTVIIFLTCALGLLSIYMMKKLD